MYFKKNSTVQITTACPALNNIVVDTTATGQQVMSTRVFLFFDNAS